MHIDENRIGIAAGGHFAQIEAGGVEWVVNIVFATPCR
jgi:hypothetical protein